MSGCRSPSTWLCHAERQDFQPFRRTAIGGRIRQTVADFVSETIDFVTIDMAVGSQEVTIEQAGTGKGPVARPVDQETANATRRTAAPTGIDAIRRVEPEGQRTRAADFER